MLQVRRKGFTLIELLVVMAIIAILAAMIFPIFTSAKESARRTQCISQLKQIGAATISYADDYGGRLPPLGAPNWGTMSILTSRLKRYVGNSDRIWLCPSDHGYKPQNVTPSFYAVYGSSYLYNGFIYSSGSVTGNTINTAKTVSGCRSPMKLILYWDWVSHPTGSTWVQNAAFGDGHVKGLNYATLADGVNNITATLFQ